MHSNEYYRSEPKRDKEITKENIYKPKHSSRCLPCLFQSPTQASPPSSLLPPPALSLLPTTFLYPYSAFPLVRLSSASDLHPLIRQYTCRIRSRYIVIVCSETRKYWVGNCIFVYIGSRTEAENSWEEWGSTEKWGRWKLCFECPEGPYTAVRL